jgi:undecaprenyl diphosphate synthase
MLEPLPWESPLPRHVAIIMDGNGRWAGHRGKPRVEGHRKGAEAVRTTVRLCRRLGLEALTLYAFSIENWKRPQVEVAGLMTLLNDYVHNEAQELAENGIRFNVIGDKTKLPSFVVASVDALAEATKDNDAMVLTLALSYGAREEIVEAMRLIAGKVETGELAANEITDTTIDEMLWMPTDVDLLIRTSGEQRVSNFLLWQLAYAEFYFTDTLWPDFDQTTLFEALTEFGRRERRFGAVGEQAC